MKKYRYVSWSCVWSVMALLLIATSGMAQDLNTPAAFELMKERSLWRQSENAAGLLLDNPYRYSELKAGYNWSKGNFRRPQQGSGNHDLDFGAEGGVFLKKMYVWGAFDYSRESLKDVDFKQSIIDPYRGMPYYVTDLNTSDWENQFYDMRFKVSLPVNQMWLVGLDGKYSVAQGAKQRDIRTTNLYYRLDVKPAVVYSFNDSQHVGLVLEYMNLKEEANPDMANTDDYQPYYELYGLGTASENVGSGKTVNYIGNRVGAGLQYGYQKDAVKLLLSGDYSYRVEDAEFSFTRPEKFGTAKEKLWQGKLLFQLRGTSYSHHVEASYRNSGIDGIQYVQQNTSSEGWQTLHSNIRSTYKTQLAGLDYALIANRENEYRWRLGVGVQYDNEKDEYLLPYSVKRAENLLFSVNGKVNIALSDRLAERLLIAAKVMYNNNLSGCYSYNGSYPDYAVVTDFEQTDLNYLVSNFYGLNGSVTYSRKIKPSQPANLYVKGVVDYRKTNDFDFGDRTAIGFALGCNF